MNFDESVFLNNLAQTSPNPFGIAIERAEGVYLYGPDGKRYTDMISGIGVTNIGHGFADELFRVFAIQQPAFELVPVNMSPEVATMVESVRHAA